jgi:hypothetical protein
MTTITVKVAQKDMKSQQNQRLQHAHGIQNNAIVANDSNLSIGRHGRFLSGA